MLFDHHLCLFLWPFIQRIFIVRFNNRTNLNDLDLTLKERLKRICFCGPFGFQSAFGIPCSNLSKHAFQVSLLNC